MIVARVLRAMRWGSRRARLLTTTALLARASTAEADVRTLLAHLSAPDARGNAPGHGHWVAGIWDDDNGEMAGKPCDWCAMWHTIVARQKEP